MKRTIQPALFLLLGMLFAAAAISHAQAPALDSLRVALEVKDRPLREVLQQIVSQTKVQLVYPDALVAGIVASCSCQNASLRQALEEILAPAELACSVMPDGQIVIVWRGWMEIPPAHAGLPPWRGLSPPPFGAPPPGSPEFIETALQDLQLSETQKASLDTIRRMQRETALEIFRKRQTHELDLESLRSARHKLHDETMRQMRSVLTETQRRQFEKRLEQGRPRPHGPAPARPRRGETPQIPSTSE